MEATKDRPAKYAGSFYPIDKKSIESTVLQLLNSAKSKVSNTIAVVSPHAGYVFSGQVAADAIKQIEANKKYDNIFIIGISHHYHFEGASVYNIGNYQMPFGTIEVNTDLATSLIEQNKHFNCYKEAHLAEHCIEVQLPLLFYHLKHKFKIVPILIGDGNQEIFSSIAKTLQPFFNENNAFVFSSDFSHYPSYDDAIKADRRTAEALISNDIEKFQKAIEQNSKLKIHNLLTSACGKNDLMVLLNLTQANNDFKYEIISYKNSGDSEYGSKDSVVGYYAIAVRKIQNFNLSEQEKQTLLKIARQTLNDYIKKGKVPNLDNFNITENLKKNLGAFVTLKINNKLRGCIGRFMPNIALWKVVQQMTIASATQDSRFNPVTENEVDKINIEISVLTPLQKINSPEEIQIGRDGIYIRKGAMSGTLLPQVATENNWSKLEFLQYCSKYKAGLGKDGWKDAEIFIYQAIVFEEK